MNDQMRANAHIQIAPRDCFVSLGEEVENYIEEINTFSFIKFLTHKYNDFKVSLLPLLRVLLRTSYNLSTNEIFSFAIKPSCLNFKNKRKIVKPYFPAGHFKKETNEQFGYSIEKQFIRFIDFVESETNIKITYEGKRGYKKRYVSYNDWIILSAFFIYYDGRCFGDRFSNEYLPFFEKNRACSEHSYRIVLSEILECVGKEKYDEISNEDIYFVVAQLQRIDEVFKIFKINKINILRSELYTTDSLKEIYNSLDLEYEEVINLKNIFDEEVFRNDDFIEKCLKLKYEDPIFIFIYFFRYYMYKKKILTTNDICIQDLELERYNPKITPEWNNLKELISISKADALEYIKIVSESEIVYNQYEAQLKDSEFLKDYYFHNHEGLMEYLKKDGFEAIEEKDDYLAYLISKVIYSLPKYKKYVK